MSDQHTTRSFSSRTATFGVSFAALAVALAASPALAESSAAPDAGELLGAAGLQISIERSAQVDNPYWVPTANDGPQAFGNDVPVVSPVPEIVIAAPGTPTTARDPVNVTGVGQMIVDQQNGFIGLCTGTLVNPRMVLFAAHCVNSRAEGAYGQNSGGQPIGFGFGSNNNVGGASAFGGWLNGIAGGARYETNTGRFMYDVNYVSYNPLSLEPDAATFLYADIATATLDTPAANVPTWALLFSQLPAVPITANGTGYHVTIDGYGNNGTGITGSTGGIDFRRRIAENTLGALASLDEFENFLFGSASTTNPQNLYWIDFDDPRRGTVQASAFDFNAWRDNAQPNEGITASGDSGGPLILDRTFARSVVIGVLSGGYTRFFTGQPANGYGTAAFYQPLYLYWDWIAANNPYHYVGSIAGNANWTDPTHWVTNLDPAYQVIVNGQLVNGIPTNPGTGNTDTPGFGQACFQSGGVSDCLDIASGTETIVAAPIGTVGNGAASVGLADAGLGSDGSGLTTSATGRPSGGELTAQDGVVAALPAATLVNGLPGATNFVPNNYDGDRVARVMPRYFDVTLGASGTTTLNSTVVIDRFTISNGAAMLDIQSTGSLTSLISITQGTGTMQVNGTLTSPGDYFMLTGGLNGTGVITTPFFTSTAGTISPGTTGSAGTIGTLTFRGNTIFASGTSYMVDLGNNGLSDLIAVQSTNATNGIANVGGRLNFSVVNGAMPLAGNTYTILTAQNSVTGAFTAPTAISAILTPVLTYQSNAVIVRLTAGSYINVVDPTSLVQVNYAKLLDVNRAANSGLLAGLYGPLDLQSVAGVRAFFESAAPRTETLRTATSLAATGTTDRFFRQRIHSLEPGEASGQLAISGNPLPLAQTGSYVRTTAPLTAGLGFVEDGQAGMKLADDTSGYLVGGYLNGNSAPMPAAASSGRDKFDGWFVALGFEKAVSNNATVGFGLSYADVNGTTGGAPQEAGSRLIQGTIYGAVASDKGLRADVRMSAGLLTTDSSRTVTLAATPYTLALKDDSMSFSVEGGLGFDLAKGGNFAIVPRASLRYETITFDWTRETGGPMALTIDRDQYKALEGRAGVSVSGKQGMKIRPYFEANYVHEFLDQVTSFGAAFVGTNSIVPFALAGTDNDWGEISGGLSISLGARAEFAVEADSTIFRDDLRNQSYRGRITIHF